MSNNTSVSPINRSKTGDGHAMTKLDVKNELAKQERELMREHKGYECSCTKCGEAFHISTQKYTREDKIALTKYLFQNCPSCKNWKTDEWHSMRNMLLQLTFTIDGKEYKTLRIPSGYRAKRILKIEESGLIKAS